ncbi:MAG: transcription antitermination factor NusB [Deltaproteobacteria bacterium]|nr:transcription antitermination factor NusB [Deltaproteobacteria bacterium]
MNHRANDRRKTQEPGPRRHAREAALQVLFSLDSLHRLTGDGGELEPEQIDRAINGYWAHLEGAPDGREYADAIVRGVMKHLTEVDTAIREANPNWRLDRMGRVDRNVLRIATYEMVFGGEVPAEVAIDEAVDLARRFGTAESASFVNGTLDKVARLKGRLRK